ncbi:penicillin-binding transpeptidase domain-containing protein [Cryptosporangium sp. NPDC051539]|uniref:peptidoglycan D,D-transpeptidase FtsI family protein n=1 Tax=Cryptosporangium sp. NPDC051539 TaxID=3363962 RepID=UPI0037AC31B0
MAAPPPKRRRADENVVPFRPRRQTLSDAQQYHPRGQTVREGGPAKPDGAKPGGSKAGGSNADRAKPDRAKPGGSKSAAGRSGASGTSTSGTGRSGASGTGMSGTSRSGASGTGRAAASGSGGKAPSGDSRGGARNSASSGARESASGGGRGSTSAGARGSTSGGARGSASGGARGSASGGGRGSASAGARGSAAGTGRAGPARAPRGGQPVRRRPAPHDRPRRGSSSARWESTGAPPPGRRQSVRMPPLPPPRRQRRHLPRLGNPNARLRISLAVMLALFVAVGGRLVQIQTTEGTQYAELAAHSRRVSLVVYAPRGAILDRDGNALAHDVEGATIAADPGYIANKSEVAAAVAPLLQMTPAQVEEKLSHDKHADGSANRYVILKKKVSLAVGDAVNRLRTKIPGLIVQSDQVREVAGGDFAANVIGYTGTDGTGLAGLESGFNDVLQGVNGERVYDEGTGGQEIPGGYNRTTAAKAGSDLVLTLDRDLQYQANKLLTARLKATKAWNGSAIVMDVKTGEIRAMVSSPSYDASNPSTAKPGTTLDLATTAIVEPGSVHKALTICGGLDAGVIKPDSVLTLPQTIEKGGVTYRDTHKHGSPDYTLMGVLAQSSNVGTIMVADRLGADRLYAYQRAFGLGTKTGVGLPGESAGIVQPPANWSGPSAGSIPIGLGVAATPLQMTAIYATLANGGMKVQPQLVKSIVSPDGTVRPMPRAKPKRVVSAQAAETVVRDMTAIATKEGTAPLAAVPGYIVAGKTGTGKRAEGNKYMPGNVTSFIGIVPADSPRYVISVFIHTPEGVGGAIAGPTFSDLAGFTLRRYGVSPSGAPAPPITLYG